MLPSSRIRSLLNRRHPDWYVGDLVEAGRGVSATVYRGETAALGAIAVRVPHRRWAASDNDPDGHDTRDELSQEAQLVRHMTRFGVPVPIVHAVEFSDEADLLVTSFVEGDDIPVGDEYLGELAARVHAADPFPGRLIAQADEDVDLLVATRLHARAAILSRQTGVPLPLPSAGALRGRLRGGESRRCTLHMDLRPANVIARGGQPLALVDWNNALRGPMALELARIAEARIAEGGQLSQDFAWGYQRIREPECVPVAAETIYRLDTAVMLALVFVSEAPDPMQAERQLTRVRSLVREIERQGGGDACASLHSDK